MMKRVKLDRHQLWVVGGNVASKYLRGNCLGMLPSTCRKPICLRLLEVLSYSCTPAAPTLDQALAGLHGTWGWLDPPPLHLPAPRTSVWDRVLPLKGAVFLLTMLCR